MRRHVRLFWLGVAVSWLAVPIMGKRPDPPSENCVISGDIVSATVDEQGNVVMTPEAAEITLGTQVVLWLSDNILAIDEELLVSHVSGDTPLWPSGDVPPLWIEGVLPLEFAPSGWLEPAWDDNLGWGRYYFGEAKLAKGEDDSRLDFEFSPHGPCTPRPWGTTPPISDDPAVWESWRDEDPDGPPPLCPFALVLLGGTEALSSGDVTFEATSELFLVRKGGYPRVLLYDFTLGPLCPEERQKPGKGNTKPSPPETIPPSGCVKDTGGYTVGTGPVGGDLGEPDIEIDFAPYD